MIDSTFLVVLTACAIGLGAMIGGVVVWRHERKEVNTLRRSCEVLSRGLADSVRKPIKSEGCEQAYRSIREQA
ncbi:hypothetical protein GCM10011348_46000 [Marinobacterium nitratireducens]|uniref:Uncharacterized protein n=1 Tax=Marinobacterium nitratireducens TaxID=518897 RepID=A0A917ZS00_9GAMM|nr:hypothetical protein [Marinobacterium nitratireducens]GGO89082.1 hypothetical protein GCM10011348_46000 [Marinobacterium nitratireducens]